MFAMFNLIFDGLQLALRLGFSFSCPNRVGLRSVPVWAVVVSMTGVSAATWLLQPPRQLRSSFLAPYG